MPRNASGIYTLPGGNPVTPGDVIEADWANTTLEDVADALTNSLSRTGAGGMLAPFRIADGNVSGPGLSYLNETNTGLYRAGSGSVWMSVLGVNTAQFSTVGLTVAAGKALTVLGNASVSGTLSVTGATTLASTLAVTGAITATGGVLGNVTAASGTSTFNNVTINGNLDMDAGSSGTITNLPNPTNPGDAANKAYVDSQDALRLALTGGTMTGAIAMSNNKVTGLATPTADQDAATKAYVDSIAQGIDAKASCRAATTANITLSGNQTIDGVAVIAGDRVLVKNQSSAAENGIYVAAVSTWSRAADANTWDELVAAYTFIENGTDNGSNGYICTIAPGGTLGTTPVTWAQFSGAGQINAGTGMSKTGNTLNVNTASSARIVVGADEIDLATTGVIADTYKSVTVDQWGRVTAGTNPTTLAGFGIGDAYTQTQTNTLLAAKLSTTGGTMSGAIAMGTNKITGLGDPTLAQDAATKNYIDTLFGSTTTAAASAAAAASSASAASASASSASGSASAAAASATSAAASFDSFDDRYLGAKTSDPTVDNDGNALITGALYFNSVANEMRVYSGSAWLASYIPATGYAQLAATNTFTANQILNVNTSSAALSITQAGSGNALYIEDVAADATPFVVSSTGAVGIGTTTPDNVTSAGIALVSNDGYYPQVVNRNKTNDASASYLVFDKDRAGAIVQSGDGLGNIVFRSFDGANYLQSAAIIGYSDGTPGTNDVPGRLSFLTTADGASAPTERLTIASTGALAVSSSYGTTGQVLTSAGAGAPPTWSAIASGNRTFTASGAIASAGLPVALNDDGTVSSVLNVTASGTSASVDTSAYIGGGCQAIYTGSAVVLVYKNNYGNEGYCIVGTLSGSTITWGTKVSYASGIRGVAACWDSTNSKLLVFYGDVSNNNYCRVGTITGTSISFGGVVTVVTEGGGGSDFSATYDAVSDRTVFAWTSVNSGYIYGKIGTTSGTSTSWGSQTGIVSATTAGNAKVICGTYSGTTTFMITWLTSSQYPNARAFTITPSTSSFGSFGGVEGIASDSVNTGNIAFNSDLNRYVAFYNNSSNVVKYQMFAVSSFNLTLVGSYTTGISDGVGSSNSPATYDNFSRQMILGYRKGSDGYIYNVPITMTESTLTFGTSTAVATTNSAGYEANGIVYYASQKKVVGGFGFNLSDRYLYSSLYTIPYSTNANWIGISEAAAANGASVSCTILGGVNTGVSGLTTGSNYYVATSGALTTAANAYRIGKALSATAFLITGNA